MSFLVAVPLPTCMGADTIQIFDSPRAASLKAASYSGQPMVALGRYIEDVSQAELEVVTRAGWLVYFYMHVPEPGWTPNPSQGSLKGLAAAQKAQRIGVPAGVSLLPDMEGVSPAALSKVDAAYVRALAKPILDAGFTCPWYEGYLCGLTLADQAALIADGTVLGVDSDYGSREPLPGVGFLAKQHPQTTLAGTLIDPHTFFPDQRGKVIVACGLPSVAPPDSGTHQDPPDEPHVA